MANDDLIERLVGDLRPVRRRSAAGDAVTLGALFAAELGLFIGLGMARPDLPVAVCGASFWWKLVSLGVIAVVGAVVAVLSFDPVASPRRGLRALVAVVALCLAAGAVVDATRADAAPLAARLDWHSGLQCVTKMVLLSLPAVAGLAVLMRRGAATDSGGTALAAGIAAAAWGAFVFVFACPFDDPLYIAVWYAVGCGLVTGVARLVLPPLTRW
jgi:hypothetical protein